MALPLPSPSTPTSSIEWLQFLIRLGDTAGRPLPVAAAVMSSNSARTVIRDDIYPSLKIIADQYGVTIPSPSVPITNDGLVSKDWYPALQSLAANA